MKRGWGPVDCFDIGARRRQQACHAAGDRDRGHRQGSCHHGSRVTGEIMIISVRACDPDDATARSQGKAQVWAARRRERSLAPAMLVASVQALLFGRQIGLRRFDGRRHGGRFGMQPASLRRLRAAGGGGALGAHFFGAAVAAREKAAHSGRARRGLSEGPEPRRRGGRAGHEEQLGGLLLSKSAVGVGRGMRSSSRGLLSKSSLSLDQKTHTLLTREYSVHAVMRSCVTQSMPKGFSVTWGWRKKKIYCWGGCCGFICCEEKGTLETFAYETTGHF